MHAPKSKPIYGTDFSFPLSKIIEDIRYQIVRARGQLNDIGSAFPGYGQVLGHVEGLLTCGLVVLHGEMEEMRKREAVEAALSTSDQTEKP